ncbi:hypothetical protein BGZ60DRAFT_469797 [Tricladium varicosporioides]|nr:hypothetical protein BGZ60DRAFT_469797 [Hymenoscyphus varicosporioides]
MHLTSLLAIAVAAPSVHAGMLRFACGQLVSERLDPLVNPGLNPSPHMHQIVGGNAFNATMSPNSDIPSQATCTTCTFTEDFSNYWTAMLYFRARNGTFKRVPIMANEYIEAANGGMTVYYLSPDDKNVKVTVPKPGFRMLAGVQSLRQADSKFVNLYRCYDELGFKPNPMGMATTDTKDLPKRHCAGGIRVNTFFPTCWDGKNLDSPDHQSHVSYTTGALGLNGTCPSTHPVMIPQIFIETIWDTGKFPKEEWPTDGSQPFVFSQGDPTGFGHHADYIFGWQGDGLQRAMDAKCDNTFGKMCLELKNTTIPQANKCSQPQKAVEDLDSWIPTLPGNMPITYS